MSDKFLHDFDVARLDRSNHRGQGGQVDAVADRHVGWKTGIVQVHPAPAKLVWSVDKRGHRAEAPGGEAQRVLSILLLAFGLEVPQRMFSMSTVHMRACVCHMCVNKLIHERVYTYVYK